MSNSNYSIGLQRLKPVHTAYGAICMPIRKLCWARDVNGLDRDVCLPRPRQDRDVDNFSRDETETRRWYVSRLSRDRDVETETTTLVFSSVHGHIRRDYREQIYQRKAPLVKDDKLTSNAR